MEFKQIGKTMLPAAQKLSDKSICIRLHTINHADDAIANDVFHHNLCWANAKRWAEAEAKPMTGYTKTIAEIKLLNIIETNMLHIAQP